MSSWWPSCTSATNLLNARLEDLIWSFNRTCNLFFLGGFCWLNHILSIWSWQPSWILVPNNMFHMPENLALTAGIVMLVLKDMFCHGPFPFKICTTEYTDRCNITIHWTACFKSTVNCKILPLFPALFSYLSPHSHAWCLRVKWWTMLLFFNYIISIVVANCNSWKHSKITHELPVGRFSIIGYKGKMYIYIVMA